MQWVLCGPTGEPLPGAHVARGRRLTFSRNGEAEAILTLSLHDEACIRLFEALGNGIPQLRVYRNGTLVFSGLWTPMNGQSQTGQETNVNLVFRDAFSILRNRLTDATVTYTATDAGAIAKALIDTTNSTHGDTTILTNSSWVETTKARDRTYEHKNIAEAIVELTEVLDGFDWYPVYLDPRDNAGKTMEFHVVASMGDDQDDARFEYGDGTLSNCVGYSFSTGLPINRARAIGDAATSEKADTTSEAIYGTYMEQVSATDVTETATLDDKAQDALRPSPAHVTDFMPDPTLAPQPWDDFWIGDTVRWNVDDGAMQQQSSPVVQSIEIGLDDSDNVENLKIGIDPEGAGGYLPPANTTRRFVQQQRDLMRRLSALER